MQTTTETTPPIKKTAAPTRRVLNREVFYKGKNIIEQGEDGYRAYYIERGRVEVLIKDGAHLLKVAELGPGDIFGEMALINNEPRSATIRALDDVTTSVISREEIEGKMKKIADNAVMALINVLAARLRKTTKGQMSHYRNLTEFQDRVAGLFSDLDESIDAGDRDKFRTEVAPLLSDLQKVLARYQRH